VARRPANSRRTSGKAATTRFHFKLLPFPVNLGPTRTYDSAMGGNTSTGLGTLTAIVYEIWGVLKPMTGQTRRLIGSHYFRRIKHFTNHNNTQNSKSNAVYTNTVYITCYAHCVRLQLLHSIRPICKTNRCHNRIIQNYHKIIMHTILKAFR